MTSRSIALGFGVPNYAGPSAAVRAERQGLRILCFDGGGVRGKASLLMLKEIMDRIGPGAKPCDFFDLIAGTSTGSLIAIMLARLGYSVDEAIRKYDKLGPQIFSNMETPRKWVMFGSPVVDEGPAEKAFREIGRVNGKDAFMISGDDNRCKCFVTTALQDRPEILVPIRSYNSTDRTDPVTHSGGKWKIWQVARAATAAPVYFKPLEISGRKFVDAGAGYNNPSIEVFHEVKNIPEYKDGHIACFVSIGTGACMSRPAPGTSEKNESIFGGLPKVKVIEDRAENLIRYLSHIASATGRVHREMQRTYMEHGPYFRFDPGPVVGAIDLADFSKLESMGRLVWDHMGTDDTIYERLKNCAEKLKAASSAAVHIVPGAVTPDHQTRGEARPPRDAIRRDWQSVTPDRQTRDDGQARPSHSGAIRRDWQSVTTDRQTRGDGQVRHPHGDAIRGDWHSVTTDHQTRGDGQALPSHSGEIRRDWQRVTTYHQTQGDGQARPPHDDAMRDWQTVTTCVEIVLRDLDEDAVPLFLAIFSLSYNFDCVLKVLKALYTSPFSDQSETHETQVSILNLVAKFVSYLWLTDGQIRLSEALVPRSNLLIRSVSYAARSLNECFRRLKEDNMVTIQDPIVSLDNNTNLGVLAEELAEALAVLESNLRQTDPIGECVRWLAQGFRRDFLSFPERVETWVLRSVLINEKPENVGLRYQLFYKVAKRSRDIHNFSAMHAIVSALRSLERIRIDARVYTTELESMKRFGYAQSTQKAQRNNKPHLQSLHVILQSLKVEISNIADARRHVIHWGKHKIFFHQIKDFVSLGQLTSSQQYVFGRDRMVSFVKKSLVNVEHLNNKDITGIRSMVEDAIQRYWDAQPKTPPLWREQSHVPRWGD